MTPVFKRIFILAITFALLLSCFAACDTTQSGGNGTETSTPEAEDENIVYTLNLSADKTVAVRGDSVTLTAVLKAEGHEDIPSEDTDFILVNGAEYASVTGNVLKISESAPDGATITVQAKEGASYSNTVTVKVSVPLTSIYIAAATDKPIAGQSVVITKVVDPSDATQVISWVITEGADFATMTGDVLMVSENAAEGTVIKLKAVSGEIESNEITLTVRPAVDEIPAESVTINADTLNPLVGESVIINASVKPTNTTDSVRYEIVDGADFASLSANVLVISKTATAGVVVKVVAYAGEVKSNELVFTVRDNTVSAETIEIYANNLTPLAGQSVAISKQVEPANTTDKVVWTIIEGADKAEMIGDVLVVKDNAVEGDVIKVQATAGTVASNVLEFVVSTTEIKANKVTISADVDNILAGQSAIIKSLIEPANSTEDIVIYITEGAQYASISGNVLVVSENAPANTVIKVVAKAGAVNSNELTFTVRDTSKPATGISISADNLNPIAGHSVTINCVVTPDDSTDKLEVKIIEGKEFANIAGNVLVVSAAAEKGSVIKVQAFVGNVESEVLEFVVRPATEEIKVESIQLSANTEVLRGQAVVINKIVNPANANQQVLWQFVEGANYATINGDTIIISADAKTGTKITVKAVAGDVESNTLTFTVQPSQEEINASKFYIDLSKDYFTLDKKGTAATPTLIAEVYNYNYEKVTDKELEFKVISGAQYLGITASGANCTFTDLKGHGTAVVEVRIKGTDIVETAEINVIVPPDAVVLPEVFAERTDIEYSFSIKDHEYTYSDYGNGNFGQITNDPGKASSLPFAPSVRGNGAVCQDLSFSFRHESGKTGDEVAVYENGKITFKMTGKVTVTVSSASGSKVEATTSYTFSINDGFNVYSFRDLHILVQSSEYTGQQINIVVLEKPVGTTCTVPGCYCGNKAYTYGYDLVPATALKDHKDQTIFEVLKGYPENEPNGMESNRIQAVNKNLYLNGNNHTIDASQIRVFSQSEYLEGCNKYGWSASGNPNVGSLLSAEPWSWSGSGNTATSKQNYEARIYNVEVKGNAPIDYDPTRWNDAGGSYTTVGAYVSGINIGVTDYDCHYYVDADNVTSSGFTNGISLTGIVGNGKIRNINVYNCYSTGIMAKGSIVTLENIRFGACGATGIEMAPAESDEAGIYDNENQKVTISGTIDASTNLNAGNTTYYQNYKVGGGYTVSMIIEGNAAGIVEAAKGYGSEAAGLLVVDHIKNSNGQFIFVSLIFNDLTTLSPNSSEVIYPDYQDGGIITVEQLLTNVLTTGQIDTTHQFIEMPIQVTGIGTVGKALFYNHNYGK